MHGYDNFSDACTPPFESVENECYFYSGGLFVASYQDAENFCQGIGGNLAIITSGDENRAVIDNYLFPNSKLTLSTDKDNTRKDRNNTCPIGYLFILKSTK